MPSAMDTSGSPFLRGLLEPVQDERDDFDLKVEGELPSGLRGIFTRNGPNPQFTPGGGYHPFDGDGMVHALYFENGKVRYRNRWVESAGLLAERKRGRACYGSVSEFLSTPQDVIEEAGMMKNNANTHFIRHGGRFMALMEAGKPTELTRDLDTVGEYDFHGRLEGPMTAHPKIDPVTGEMVFFGYSPMPPYLQYYVADRDGNITHHAVIDIPTPVLMHDFAVTRNYTIFLDSPVVFDVEAMFRGEPGIRWEPELGTRLGVLPRMGSADQIRWFDIDTCSVVHFANAWESDGKIEIHAPTFASMPGGLRFDSPVQSEEPFPYRWSIDLAAGAVNGEWMDDRSGEFPRINDNFACQQSRYLYNSLARDWAFEFNFNGVIKYDLETGSTREFIYGSDETSGEHAFAPDPEGTAEDDGWLMSIVSDRETRESYLSILDARDVEAGPVARVRLPRRVPIGFHANWLAEC
jgi:carotenoid cleavage dioxygenase-like enzyme